MKLRTIAYIDGFNLYHAVKDLNRPELKWVNLWSLSESLLRKNETLQAVKYFSAYATWIPDAYARHRRYTKALMAEGCDLVLGRFKDKHLICHKCGRRYTTKEEKETDVNIAIHLVADGLHDHYDRAILITADTDLSTAVDMARHHLPDKEIFVVAPPGRMQRARGLHHKYELKPGRLVNHLLKDEYRDESGKVIATRPETYKK
ncbi:MAG: NYN domain-containing protein [Pseudomonadota bacterium]